MTIAKGILFYNSDNFIRINRLTIKVNDFTVKIK